MDGRPISDKISRQIDALIKRTDLWLIKRLDRILRASKQARDILVESLPS